ncbi:MAG: transketolase [Candidatus Anammoximicrobium sp.]|nr:transketolase [Candidatus Anammoximicrobium sp.]
MPIMTAKKDDRRQLAINTIRTLSMDAVQKANSGHPGTPMSLAPVAYAVWNRQMRYDPEHPWWPARDRFVLSCGHASMLLYSLLHLVGVRKVERGQVLDQPAVSLDDIRNFRQLGSPCAGHPEYGDAAGIEMTTGPLGQGIATSVGMALAGQWFAARYNQPGFDLFGYDVYALCGDGDMMEGVGCEAASLAGHLKLSNLCWIYDDNGITIEGHTDLAFSEDVAKRFRGLGWNTVTVEDANDVAAMEAALAAFRACHDRPTLIVVRSVIGYGSPNKANTHDAHGAPLGEDEIRLTKRAYGWPEDQSFLVPEGVREHFAEGIGARGRQLHADWAAKFALYEATHPQLAAELTRIWARQLPDGWDKDIPVFPADAKGLASRVSSGQVLCAVAKNVPWLVGGSADLAPSNNTLLKVDKAGHFSAQERGGRNLHFGIREHGMGSVCNGMALSGLRPFGGTFFVFSDYMRPAMRLAAMMHQSVLYVLTHDSIGLGEDGPTHQPVEHLAACRAIPGLLVFRPADANEVAESYRQILAIADRPAALVLTRQNLPTLDRSKCAAASGVARGGYVLLDAPNGQPDVILIGTGSEVPLCLEAQQKLAAEGVAARVVSMPCWELFDAQDQAYRDSVLPPQVTARVAVEAGIRQGWDRYLGSRGRFVGMSGFGASGPFKQLYERFGITASGIVAQAQAALADK